MNKYDPKDIEPKWQKVWEEKGTFRAEDFSKKPKYYALTEFPYPSGDGLHTGHVFNYTIPDIFARTKRMQGNNVLFPMGWDAFGLPTENYAIKTGIKPQTVTKNNTDRFRSQMKMLGLSFDWSREINTTDPKYYKWTQYIFQLLFKHGLAYKAATKVGWCPNCKIVLAKEETVNGKCERCGTEATEKVQSQWVLRITSYADRLDFELDGVDYPDYVKASQRNWIGRKEGINITYDIHGSTEKVTVFTTRPDTNFGATFVVVAPEHPILSKITAEAQKAAVEEYVERARRKSEMERATRDRKKTGVFTGSYAVNQLNGRKMPIWVADFALIGFGTGALVGVPGHDKRDFEFAKEFDLEIVRVVVGKDDDKGEITDISQVQEEAGVMINSEFLDGMDIHAATTRIIEHLEGKGWGKRVTTYHLRDWIFSRQHYWGDPTPMVFCEKCAQNGVTWWDTEEANRFKPMFDPKKPTGVDGNRRAVELAGWMPIPEKELPVVLPEVERYQPSDNGESPLATMEVWVQTTCPNCGGPAKRETDTMPNWAGSSWYYLRYCDVFNDSSIAKKNNLEYWMPVDMYFGGAEHTTLHVLYSRFWHKFLNDLNLVPGKEPYAARRQHGMILAEGGAKMSKSKGNVVNPDHVVGKYGADALRTYVAFMGPYDQTMPWQTAAVEGVNRFLGRVFKMYSDRNKISSVKTETRLRGRLDKAIRRTTDGIMNLRQNVGVAALMEFLNEWEKEGEQLSKDDAGDYLKLVSVYAPHLAEELWQKLQGSDGVGMGRFISIHTTDWPMVKTENAIEEEIVIAVSINGKTRGTVKISSQEVGLLGEKGIVTKAQTLESVRTILSQKKVKNTVYVPGRIVNFVTD
jgi:leucyl-tRNA synthetase